MKKIKINPLWVIIAFCLLAAVYFTPLECGIKKSFATIFLGIVSWFYVPWTMALAFVFSFIGDLMGDFHQFVPQMASFALGHVFFVIYFIGQLKGKAKWNTANFIFFAIFVFAASWLILPHVGAGLNIGVGIYMCLIVTMGYFAYGSKKPLAIIGATLFIISDFILAYNKFVERLPLEHILIMVPYYGAQISLFAAAACRNNEE